MRCLLVKNLATEIVAEEMEQLGIYGDEVVEFRSWFSGPGRRDALSPVSTTDFIICSGCQMSKMRFLSAFYEVR